MLRKHTIPPSEIISDISKWQLNVLVCQNVSEMKARTSSNIRSQSCRCQCPGDVRGQSITGHHIDLGITDYFMILIYSFRFTHLQPGADPGGSCRPVAWRCQLSIKSLGTRFTAWRRTCVFFTDRSVTFQGHICPSSCGKIRSVRIGAPVTDLCARQV